MLSEESKKKGQEALQKYRQEQADAKAKGEDFYKQWLADRAAEKARSKTTPLKAIKEFCIDCSNDQIEEVRNCGRKTCPLYLFRPYQ